MVINFIFQICVFPKIKYICLWQFIGFLFLPTHCLAFHTELTVLGLLLFKSTLPWKFLLAILHWLPCAPCITFLHCSPYYCCCSECLHLWEILEDLGENIQLSDMKVIMKMYQVIAPLYLLQTHLTLNKKSQSETSLNRGNKKNTECMPELAVSQAASKTRPTWWVCSVYESLLPAAVQSKRRIGESSVATREELCEAIGQYPEVVKLTSYSWSLLGMDHLVVYIASCLPGMVQHMGIFLKQQLSKWSKWKIAGLNWKVKNIHIF